MKLSKVTLAVALVALFLACSTSARVLLQDGRPSQCDAKTGHWEVKDFNCDFTCSNAGWELDCKAHKTDNLVKCKLDKDGAPDSETIKFQCKVVTSGQTADCGDFSAVNAVSDACVKDIVKAVLGAWKPEP